MKEKLYQFFTLGKDWGPQIGLSWEFGSHDQLPPHHVGPAFPEQPHSWSCSPYPTHSFLDKEFKHIICLWDCTDWISKFPFCKTGHLYLGYWTGSTKQLSKNMEINWECHQENYWEQHTGQQKLLNRKKIFKFQSHIQRRSYTRSIAPPSLQLPRQ